MNNDYPQGTHQVSWVGHKKVLLGHSEIWQLPRKKLTQMEQEENPVPEKKKRGRPKKIT